MCLLMACCTGGRGQANCGGGGKGRSGQESRRGREGEKARQGEGKGMCACAACSDCPCLHIMLSFTVSASNHPFSSLCARCECRLSSGSLSCTKRVTDSLSGRPFCLWFDGQSRIAAVCHPLMVHFNDRHASLNGESLYYDVAFMYRRLALFCRPNQFSVSRARFYGRVVLEMTRTQESGLFLLIPSVLSCSCQIAHLSDGWAGLSSCRVSLFVLFVIMTCI